LVQIDHHLTELWKKEKGGLLWNTVHSHWHQVVS